jgi:hypothetical protein
MGVSVLIANNDVERPGVGGRRRANCRTESSQSTGLLVSVVVNRDLQPAARMDESERDRRLVIGPLHRNNPALARLKQHSFVQPRAARIGVVKSLNNRVQTAPFQVERCFQRYPVHSHGRSAMPLRECRDLACPGGGCIRSAADTTRDLH